MSRSRYKIIIEDEAHPNRLAQWKLRWWVVLPMVLIVLAALTALAVAIIMNTPLKQMLPGYLPPHERAATMDDLMKVDSLQRKYDVNEQYLNNLLTVLDIDRTEGDSVRQAALAVKATTDSLMPATSREKEFRAMIEERERYNLSILSPLAADGMIFEDPAPGYTFARGSEGDYTARLIIPVGESVRTLTDGLVIDTHFAMNQGYTMTILHPNGFVSSWSRLGQPLIEQGEKVSSGQAIAPTARGNGLNSNYVTLRIWRNSTPLVPYAILRGDRTLAPDAVMK